MNSRTPGGRSPFGSAKGMRKDIRMGYGDGGTVSRLGDGDTRRGGGAPGSTKYSK
jgi:hypothetical protein